MLIYTIWVNDRAEFDEAWMLDAWDEFTIDANSEGWDEVVEKAKSAFEEVRVIPVEVDIEKARHAFEIQPIKGEVKVGSDANGN